MVDLARPQRVNTLVIDKYPGIHDPFGEFATGRPGMHVGQARTQFRPDSVWSGPTSQGANAARKKSPAAGRAMGERIVYISTLSRRRPYGRGPQPPITISRSSMLTMPL